MSMSEQPSREAVRNKTLHILVRSIGLTPEEVSLLRLTHLRLAGKNPNISFTTTEHNRPKIVELDLDAHRALVSWLVARPDAMSDFLFPGEGEAALEPAEIRQAVQAVDLTDGSQTTRPVPPASTPFRREPASEDEAGSDEATMAGRFGPKPPPVRPAAPMPPPSAPEMGAPPPGFTRPVGPQSTISGPPLTAPEAEAPPGPPDSASRPFPPPLRPGEADRSTSRPVTPPAMSRPEGPPAGVAARQDARPVSRPVRKRDSVRVPPKPVRKKDGGREPVVAQQPEAEAPPLNASLVEPSSPAVTGEKPLERSQPPATEPKPVTETPPPDQVAVPLEAKPALRVAEAPKRETSLVSEEKPKPQVSPKTEALKRPEAKSEGSEAVRPAMFSFALGGLVSALLLCVVCVGGIGWFAFQSEAGSELVASLGLIEAEPPEEATEESALESAETPPDEAESGAEAQPNSSTFESPLSPLATPTLPPTSTPTPLPATNTPPPTDTATAAPPGPTDTPLPTDTSLPPDTPTPEPVEETPTPEESAPTPTSEFKYGAPALLGPENEFKFIGNSEILFRWAPVNLAADEQYAVRVRYKYNNQITYQGAQVKEPQWAMPPSLYLQIDPPEHRYEWFVVIERLNADGSGTAISPQSEVRLFFWY